MYKNYIKPDKLYTFVIGERRMLTLDYLIKEFKPKEINIHINGNKQHAITFIKHSRICGFKDIGTFFLYYKIEHYFYNTDAQELTVELVL